MRNLGILFVITVTLTACGYMLYYPRLYVERGYSELNRFEEKLNKEQQIFWEKVSKELEIFECVTCEVAMCLKKLEDDLGFCATSEIATAHCIDHASNFCRLNGNTLRCEDNL